MNKSVKKVIALTLVLGTVYSVAPDTNIKFFTTKAYAATTNAKDTLDSLKLETSGGSNIKLYDDDDYKSSNKVDSSEVTKGSTYYAKTDRETVSLSISGPSSSYVKVFKGTSSSTKGKSVSSNISLSPSSTTTLVIRVYSAVPESNVRYDDKTNVLSEYKIKVKCTSSDSDSSSGNSDSSQYDNIYLEKLSVDGVSLSLSESRILYTYNVDTNVYQVTIKAEPENSDDIVRIDGVKVYEDDGYKKTVSLSAGENKIKIEVEDEEDDDNRIYTLNIIREDTKAAIKNTGWVQANGKWIYIDETGVLKKNIFFTDKVNGKTYYLGFNGEMAIGWNKINWNWYYFEINGVIHTGWLNTDGKWYYLDSTGMMKTGWIIDKGKYYYLYSDGSMAANTKIGPYTVDGSGAWIG